MQRLVHGVWRASSKLARIKQNDEMPTVMHGEAANARVVRSSIHVAQKTTVIHAVDSRGRVPFHAAEPLTTDQDMRYEGRWHDESQRSVMRPDVHIPKHIANTHNLVGGRHDGQLANQIAHA
jgi:hypothetical protein